MRDKKFLTKIGKFELYRYYNVSFENSVYMIHCLICCNLENESYCKWYTCKITPVRDTFNFSCQHKKNKDFLALENIVRLIIL